MNLLEAIARDLRRPEEQLRLPADLLRQGYDPSYLARVRPDELNQLDAATLARLRRALRFREQLQEYKDNAVANARERGVLTEALTNAIARADSKAEVNALTKFGASRRGTKSLAAATPLAEKLATEVLMHNASTPSDFREWAKSVTGVDDSQIDSLIQETKVYLQALLLEDAGLVSKVFDFIKHRAVLQSSELTTNSGEETASDAEEASKSSKKRKRKRGKKDNRDTSVSTGKVASDESASTAENAIALDSSSETEPVPSEIVASADNISTEDISQQEQQSNEESTEVTSQELAGLAASEASDSESSDTVENASETTAIEQASEEGDAAAEIVGFETPTKKTRAVSAKELSPRQRRRRWLKFQLEPYYKLRRSLGKLSPFQIVMLGRGNRSQILKVELDYDRKAVSRMAKESLFPKDHPLADFLNEAVDEAVNGALTTRIEQEVLAAAEEHAQQELIEYAVEHLQTLLMQRPLRSHRIMMIDAIGTKSAAVVIVDPEGRIDHVAELPCNSSRPDAVNHNVKLLGEWAYAFNVSVLAVSTGPARRFVLPSIREFMSQCDPEKIRWTMVDRDGADTYCTTRIALQELPNLSRRHRAAAWLAWRLQDPLVQLLKVDPTRLRLAVFQAELPQDLVEESLKEAVASSVAVRGVDYWNAHPETFSSVPGLDAQSAKAICAVRDSERPSSREALVAALQDKLTPTSLRQAIGFIRVFESAEPLDGTLIHPDDYRLAQRLISNTELSAPPAAPVGWTKQSLAAISESSVASDSAEVAIEQAPESFAEGISEQADAPKSDEPATTSPELVDGVSESVEASNSDFATEVGSEAASSEENLPTTSESSEVALSAEASGGDATSNDVVASLSSVTPSPSQGPVKTFGGHDLAAIHPDFSEVQKTSEAAKVDAEKLARMWQVGREKLKFVAQVLQHPFDDPRDLGTSIPLMKRVPKIEDLTAGTSLWAIVSGIADFGVFADLGPDCSGLIHVSRLSANYVEDPRQVVNVGDLIQVWVQEVDVAKRRISLSALPPGVVQKMRIHGDSREPSAERSERGPGKGFNRGAPRQRDGGRPAQGQRPDQRGGDRSGGERGQSTDSKPFANRDRRSTPQQSGAGGGQQNRDRSYSSDRRDNRGDKGRDRRGRRGTPNFDAATVVDLPSKDLPNNARKGNASTSDSASTGKEPMRSFSDLLARFQTQHEENKQPPKE